MKKLLLVFVLLLTLLLCSCRKINQPDDTGFTSSNSSEINSDYSSSNSSLTSSVVSDLILPERDDLSTGSNTSTSTQQDIVTSYGEMNTSSEAVSYNAKLAIDVDKQYYRSSVSVISFTLYNENKGIFTYKTDFFLQKYEDGKWKYYTTKSGEIDYKFNTADSESHVVSILYDLNKQYNTPLPFGTYRFIQESDDGTITSNSFEIVDDSFFDGPQ